MTSALLRDSIDLLLQEAYDGPPNPRETWFVNNAHESGVLGTVRHLSAAQAWHRPEGLAHSVAEHVTHILFSLQHAARCAAKGKELPADWDHSWDCGPQDEGHWQTMQRQLRESQLRLRMWVHADETFDTKESVTRLLGAIAHAAYHLGAIRQIAALSMREAPAEDSMTMSWRPR